MHPTVPATRASRLRSGRVLWLAATLTLVALPALADVYKWLDVQGNIHYSDRPPPADAKLLSVEAARGIVSQRPPPPPAAPPPSVAPGAVPLPPPTPEQANRLKKVVDADVAGARAEQCKGAQERYQKYVGSRRIFREGSNKERVYLTDAEADQERVNARREIEDLCGEAPAQ